MNKNVSSKLMVPFLKGVKYHNLALSESIVYGRFSVDFQKDCLLFTVAGKNSITCDDIAELRSLGLDVCYVYDMLDLENREFTDTGFLAINRDIRNIIKSGFTHILLSNAYLIELVCNEYGDQIKVVISQLLECNSSRSRIFFDVLNDTSCISHLIVSQNHLTRSRLSELESGFEGVQLIVEPDRWASDIQMIHEHYYNVVYGYYNSYAVDELKKFTTRKEIVPYVKTPDNLHLDYPGLMYKIGEINMDVKLYEHNVNAILEHDFRNIKISDFSLW